MDKKVNAFVQSRSRFMPPASSMASLTLDPPNMNHSDSNGFLVLEAGDARRKQGSSMIAHQIQVENMKARQINAHQKQSDKNLDIINEQQMNKYLDKINHENHEAEQWSLNIKKQRAREDIEESLHMRATTDAMMADRLVMKET